MLVWKRLDKDCSRLLTIQDVARVEFTGAGTVDLVREEVQLRSRSPDKSVVEVEQEVVGTQSMRMTNQTRSTT